ncbi:MAG: hydrogenase maturation protein [Burkholderiales bacterium]|nr:hydrogenase maturation protein [Burkholderiales bacterium]
MRILFLTRSFNSLTQRLCLELAALGHEVAIELDIADAVTIEAVALYRPALIVAPFLKRAIPEQVWRDTVCLVVHPGIVADRGPSALDWAIAEGEREWGVTVLQAQAEMDAGPVWAAQTFAMRAATKSSLYRNEVSDAAARAVVAAVRRFGEEVEAGAEAGAAPRPEAAGAPARGRWRPLMAQADRQIHWQQDDTQTILRKIRAADGTPGVLDRLFDTPCHLFDAHPETLAQRHEPGRVIGRRNEAVLRATIDGAVWIGHVRRADQDGSFKLPTALAFPAQTANLPESQIAIDAPADASGYREIWYEARGGVGYLHFPFHNGAMSTAQCERLTAALRFALAQPPRVLVLFGGADFWSNGIHLNVIEAADSPADESWRNINAIDDLTLTLIEATKRVIIAAMQGNAGAGGVFMALAADQVWARRSVVLNPHYKNMGNLYGSEYWTYLLPRRLKSVSPGDVMKHRLPVSAMHAAQTGLVDAVFGDSAEEFVDMVRARATALAASAELPVLLQNKQQQRRIDEARKPLAEYREEELAHMRRNFYGFDPSYHIARSNFVHRVAPSWTPRHLAVHRRFNDTGWS